MDAHLCQFASLELVFDTVGSTRRVSKRCPTISAFSSCSARARARVFVFQYQGWWAGLWRSRNHTHYVCDAVLEIK